MLRTNNSATIALQLFLAFSVGLLACQSLARGQDQQSSAADGWTDLFNGNDFAGWIQKNGTADYTIEEGGVICGTTKQGSPNSFLCTEKHYGDFELTFDVKVSDELNSGVQIRSQTKELTAGEKKSKQPFGRVNGPQVEIEASKEKGAEAGYVYGEATGRGWLTPEKRLAPTKVFQDGQWNSFRILAEGPRIQTWINGEPIEDLTDDAIYKTHSSGFIGLQVHGIGKKAGPFQVRWRNLKLRELNVETAHSFLGCGKAARTVIVGENGEIEWKLDLPSSDGWVLENGNVLLAIYPNKKFPQGGVGEVDRETKEFVWKYQGQQKEISTVEQVGDDEYLVAELGETPRAIVINRAGEILKEMPFDCQQKNVHMQTRMLRLLPNGNYIAPHLLDFAVKEYEPATGKVVRSIATDDRGREKKDWPFTAIRLKNGNTVIGCTNGNRVIEVDADGKIVWSVDNDDLGESLIDDACGVQRLPNGNTVISSYHAKGDKAKLIEVNRDKKVVWRFDGLKSGFHHFQILTTNGKSVPSALK
jgi:hypothetical protein